MKFETNTIINAPIETVWDILNSRADLKLLDEKIISSTLISDTGKTKTYEETYAEGNKQETYIITVTTLRDDDIKHQKFDFVIANSIKVTGEFKLTSNNNTTTFTYSGTNSGVNILGKIMIFTMGIFQSKKLNEEFVIKVKQLAESRV